MWRRRERNCPALPTRGEGERGTVPLLRLQPWWNWCCREATPARAYHLSYQPYLCSDPVDCKTSPTLQPTEPSSILHPTITREWLEQDGLEDQNYPLVLYIHYLLLINLRYTYLIILTLYLRTVKTQGCFLPCVTLNFIFSPENSGRVYRNHLTNKVSNTFYLVISFKYPDF